MIGFGNVRIKGVSGKEYKFRAYILDTKFQNFSAVYFISNRLVRPDGRISHSRIYCGQTMDISSLFNYLQGTLTFKAHKANCICILPKEDEISRLEIERDIHQNYRFMCQD